MKSLESGRIYNNLTFDRRNVKKIKKIKKNS